MKKLLKFLSTLLFGLILTTNLFAQWCTTPDYVPQSGGNQIQSVYESKNGETLPASGTIRVLIIFYEVNYDVGNDPSPTSPGWPAHALPTWASPANLLVDANPPIGPTPAVLTEYFRQASSGLLNVIGDYLLSPVNGGIFTIDRSEFNSPPVNLMASLCDHINTPMGGNFVTGTGLNNASYFDNWTKTGPGVAKISPSTDSPHKYDHVMIIWRNLPGYSGQGFADPSGINLSNILNYKADTYSFFGAHHITGELPFTIARHEFSHLLYGGGNFHCGGGGWGGGNTFDNYWVPLVSGWSNLGLYNSSIQTWNAWDRQFMDWKPSGNTFNPAARDAGNTSEKDGDLDASNPAQAGIYTLRDFVTTGDAIRIKLPFTDPASEYSQWIWIENHNGEAMNGSQFDRFQYQGMGCINPQIYGLYMYMQIDKDVRQAATPDEIYSPFVNFADYLRPITADGRYDREYAAFVGNPCHWGIGDWPIIRNKPSALSGNSDQDFGSFNNLPGDGILTSRDQREPYLENVAGMNVPGLLLLGDSRHAFTFTGNKKLGIGTNPSSASLMNTVGFDVPLIGAKNLQKVYINGISVEILNQAVTGEIQVQIKFDDVDVDRDTRWCADEIILNPITTPLGYSLNILPLKTLTIDQGKTATRMDNPQMIGGVEVFASQTIMRCLPNTYVHLDEGSTMILDNISTVELQNMSKIVVENKARLIVRNSSTLNLLANSLIQVKSGGRLILEDKSFLRQENNSRVLIEAGGTLEYQKNANIYLNGPNAVLEIAGFLSIKNNATFTFNYTNSNHGYVKFDNVTLTPSRNISAGSNCNISFTGSSQNKKVIQVDQATLYTPVSLVNFKISNGKAELAAGARILVEGLNTIVNLNNAKFTSTTPGVSNGHKGLHLFGQPNVIIDNCIFEYGAMGIYAFQTPGGSGLNVSNSIFRNNTRGLTTYDKGCNLLNCSFTNNQNGYSGGNMSFPSSSIGGLYKGNAYGSYWHSYSTASYTLDNANVSGNNTGVKNHAAPLNIKCGTISYNKYGIVIHYGASLRMDDQVAFPNASAVTAIGNYMTIQAWRARNLFLNMGFNDFTPSGIIPQATISGTMISGGPNPIIANSNKWNSAGTLTPSDYNLHDLNGNNITVSDLNPRNSIIACGQAIPPCPLPPCNIMYSPVNYCPGCEIINTPDFVNKKLNEATSIPMSMLQSRNRIKYRNIIPLFYQILNEDIPNPDEKESYLLDLNYLKLLETVGNAFSNNQILCSENSSNLCPEIIMTIDIENKLIDKAVQESNYHRKYLYTLDKAQTYRIACRQDLCLDVLRDILNWAEPDDIEEVNKLMCAVELEVDVLAGRIDIGNISETIYKCNRSYEFRSTDASEKNSITSKDPETTISVFPNPASDVANIRTNIENAYIVLYDGLGRTIFNEKINYDSDIDLSSMADGIYTLKVENIKTSEYWIQKLVVQ